MKQGGTAGELDDSIPSLADNLLSLSGAGFFYFPGEFSWEIRHFARIALRWKGKVSSITLDTESGLFQGMKPKCVVGRYHSLAAIKESLPPQLKITAVADDGEIMAVEHREHPVYGVQFHPESILTPDGKAMIENFLRR